MFSGERNFFVAYGRAPDPRGAGPRTSARRYEIMNTNIKRWSVGSPIQAPLDALLDLIREHGIKADDVEQARGARRAPGRQHHRDNRNMPDICMQHMCAVMLLDGIVTFESSHDERRMRDPEVLALRSAHRALSATTS